jgi:flagellar biosynthetic protein FliR
MHFTTAEITAWLGSFLWPFFRIGAMAMAAPFFGARSVPVKVRLMLALSLSILIAPGLPAAPAVEPFSLVGLTITLQQILIGIAMGFILQLVFAAIITGGQMIGMQMGLGFASMVDPQNGTQVPVLAQFYLMMTTLLFLGMDGHLLLIDLLAESFRLLPIGGEVLSLDAFWAIASWGSQMFAGGVWLALPAAASLLMVNIAFGIMARSAPQLNIFAIGFPVTMMMGFVVVLYTLPNVVPQFSTLLSSGFELVRFVIAGGE